VIRFIAALIGYYLLKFPGAILGYLVGSFIENFRSVKTESEPSFRSNTAGNSNFSESFLILTAAVLRADGSVTRTELHFVTELYKQNFGIDKTRSDMLVLRDILRGEINWEAACYGINQMMIKTERVKLIHYLFGIAKADGTISVNEINIIQNIARKINLSQYDFEFVKSKFAETYNREFWEEYTGSSSHQQPSYYRRHNHYKTLSIELTATDEEIKTAYRKLARQYHPDKHASKSAEEIKIAEEKFKSIQQAYNEIKKERGL